MPKPLNLFLLSALKSMSRLCDLILTKAPSRVLADELVLLQGKLAKAREELEKQSEVK